MPSVPLAPLATLAAPVPGPALPPYAGLRRRVLATLLDHAVLAAVTWLAFPLQPVTAPTLAAWPRTPAPDAAPWTWPGGGWVVATLAALVLLQGWTGSTPGKLVVGIAVVGDDARPVGIVLTLLRVAGHLLDSVLLIGYLRVLWHPRRRTFADSIASTVVVVTRRPPAFAGWPFARGAVPGAPPPGGELPEVPAWRVRLTAAAVAVCAAGVVVALGPYSTWSAGDATRACSAPQAGGTVLDATLAVTHDHLPASRSGIVRTVRQGDAGVTVAWSTPTAPTTATLRLELTGTAGTRRYDHQVVDGRVVGAAGEPLEDGRTGVVLPLSVLDGLGEAWTWHTSMVTPGGAVATCEAPGPPSDPGARPQT